MSVKPIAQINIALLADGNLQLQVPKGQAPAVVLGMLDQAKLEFYGRMAGWTKEVSRVQLAEAVIPSIVGH